eukprot:scaffold18135_cov116-Isochrysis_galbana.AAC.4
MRQDTLLSSGGLASPPFPPPPFTFSPGARPIYCCVRLFIVAVTCNTIYFWYAAGPAAAGVRDCLPPCAAGRSALCGRPRGERQGWPYTPDIPQYEAVPAFGALTPS